MKKALVTYNVFGEVEQPAIVKIIMLEVSDFDMDKVLDKFWKSVSELSDNVEDIEIEAIKFIK